MRKIFPISVLGKNFKSVILSTLIYTLITLSVSIVIGCFSIGGILGIVINVFRQAVLLYCVSGIVVAVLSACDLLDRKWFE